MSKIISLYNPKFISPYSTDISLDDRISKVKNSDNFNYKTQINLINISTALANTLRRTFSSLCPTIIFDNTYNENESLNSIQISENTSALHNEFLSHRLSLLPIRMNVKNPTLNDDDERKNNYLCFETYLDEITRERKFKWGSDTIPIFRISTALDSSVRNDIFDITTRDFEVVIGDTLSNTLSNDFFPKDYFTGDEIVINKLKINLLSEQKIMEKIDLQCTPTIGLGVNYTGYDPTGTVEYSFVLDSDDKIKKVFEDKINYMNIERVQKELKEYDLSVNSRKEFTHKDVKEMYSSYKLLDKQRVYKQNSEGNPAEFSICVESIGFLNSDQIILDSSSYLLLQLYDVRNSIDIDLNAFSINLLGEYIDINDFVENNIHEGLSIIIKEHTHTLGNLLQNYLRKSSNLIIANYRMPHPAIKTIEFIMGTSNKLSKEELITKITNSVANINRYSDIDEFVLKNTEINTTVVFEKYPLVKTLIVIEFILAINMSIHDLTKFITEFKSASGLDKTTYLSV